jgi:hypothetical protein
MAWNDEKKALVISEYKDIMENQFKEESERAAHSLEVVKQLALKHGESANGVRMILQKAEVYIKKDPTAAAKSATKSADGAAPKRINKADAIQDLRNAIKAIDPALVDEDVLDKLTGKAAAYFTSLFLLGKGE